MKFQTLTDAQIDELLERFDQTDSVMQRRIVAKLAAKAGAYVDMVAVFVTAPDPGLPDDELAAQYRNWHAGCEKLLPE